MTLHASLVEPRVAVLVDCDNTTPDILDHALQVVAQFGRVVLRRGYGNHATLANKWQQALVRLAFTPCLQYQYAAGKNTADIALALDALEAMFDERADRFCIVTSDSDFAYLCRKLRERGAIVYIVGAAKTPAALRNASDQFFEWTPPEPAASQETSAPSDAADSQAPEAVPAQAAGKAAAKVAGTAADRATGTAASPASRPASANKVGEAPAKSPAKPAAKPPAKSRPEAVVRAVSLLAADTPDGRVGLGALGQYLKRTDPSFSPKVFGYPALSDMVRAYPELMVTQNGGSGLWVSLRPKPAPRSKPQAKPTTA